MCNGFWYELKQWLKAFTLIEIILCLVEAVMLVLLVGFLVFLVLHLSVCPKHDPDDPTTRAPVISTTPSNGSHTDVDFFTSSPTAEDMYTMTQECTWIPSQQTEVKTRYYLSQSTSTTSQTPAYAQIKYDPVESGAEGVDDELATSDQMEHVLALVKLRPPDEITFGCLLTRVSSYWALTAASCVRAVEDAEPVEGFILLEHYGAVPPGRSHALQTVVAHPAHSQAAYDLAALRSEDQLAPGVPNIARASLLDYFLVTPGDRFHVLGFGGYRSVLAGEAARALRRAAVHAVPAGRCGAGSTGARHLWRGTAVRQAACGAHCGAASLCAGPRAPRGAPCNYCAGAPLVRAGRLYGIMSEGGRCGVACGPETFVNIALVREWIDSLMEQNN